MKLNGAISAKKQADRASEDLLCHSSSESDRELYVTRMPPDTTVYSEYVMLYMSTDANPEVNGNLWYFCTELTCVKFFSTTQWAADYAWVKTIPKESVLFKHAFQA